MGTQKNIDPYSYSSIDKITSHTQTECLRVDIYVFWPAAFCEKYGLHDVQALPFINWYISVTNILCW